MIIIAIVIVGCKYSKSHNIRYRDYLFFNEFMEAAKTYLFYGTLRTGMSNYQDFKDVLDSKGKIILKGFKLYAKKGYPYAVQSDSRKDTIVAEKMEVHSIEVRRAIYKLEIAAGYYYDELLINNQKFGIFLFSQQNSNDPQIIDGDWVNYTANTNF
jgi:gamma-glutamylcyclotransferase (GGCT)/AIG2-like uncharacterized protein YtfP